MSMPVSSPSYIRFVAASTSSEAGGDASLLLGSSAGNLQVCPVNGDLTKTQVMYAPISERKEVMTAMAASSSGQLVCVGTSTGNIAQYVLGVSETTKLRTNEVRMEVLLNRIIDDNIMEVLDILL